MAWRRARSWWRALSGNGVPGADDVSVHGWFGVFAGLFLLHAAILYMLRIIYIFCLALACLGLPWRALPCLAACVVVVVLCFVICFFYDGAACSCTVSNGLADLVSSYILVGVIFVKTNRGGGGGG